MENSDKKRTPDSDGDGLLKSSDSKFDTRVCGDKSSQGTDEKEQHTSTQAGSVDTLGIAQDGSTQQDNVRQENVRQEKGGFENSKEPTRYGDWEIAGRCVDF